MNITNIDNKECCGCSLCSSICACKAITMEPDEKGFLRPILNVERCISCGLCYKLCKEKESYGKKPIKAYAIKNQNKDILRKSSSGGASRALIESVINQGGVVYGAAYTEEFSVVMSRATTLEECDKFYGSKYVAADVNNSYISVLEDLKNGRIVLYVSTSCYVAGLYAFLKYRKCNMDLLITADFICHGVPSPKLFKDYVRFVDPKNDLVDINFRSKLKPWKYGKPQSTLIRRNGNISFNTPKALLFLRIYERENCIREHCYTCPYVEAKRPSDFTLSDFWHVENVHPEFYSELGVSAVQINTDKGIDYWKNIDNLVQIQTKVENILNNNLHSQVRRPESTDDFWSLYFERGFMAIAKEYGGYSFMNNIKQYFRNSKLYSVWRRFRYGE